jgi:hypothetical protein
MTIRANKSEKRRTLPGDHYLPAVDGRITHAITIDGRPEDIWPWLQQMGCRRAGWYSYDWLDNGGAPSSEKIIKRWQHLKVGDRIPGSPSDLPGEGFEVIDLKENQYFVLSTFNHLPSFAPVRAEETPDAYWRTTWCFFLEPLNDQQTRLLVRSNLHFRPKWLVYPLAQLIARPLHFFMQRKQLNGIKTRAESMTSTEIFTAPAQEAKA